MIITHKSNDWLTPDWLLARIRDVFGGRIDLDPCGHVLSHVNARRTLYPHDNGLSVPWHGRVFANPPYKPNVKAWYHKAWVSRSNGAQTLLLVPAWTESTSFQFYGVRADAICFLRGRLRFRLAGVGEVTGAANPHCLLSFGVDNDAFATGMDGAGWIVFPCLQTRFQKKLLANKVAM